MMHKGLKILLIALIGWLIGCKDTRIFSPVPYLEFEEYILFSKDFDPTKFPFDHSQVTLYFTDGDGNLGQEASFEGIACCDTCNFYCNLFVDVYSKVDGVYGDEYAYNARIDDMTPAGQDPTLEGQIIYKVSLAGRFSDTVKMEFYIYDRDLQKSNLVAIPEIWVDL